VFVSLTVLRCIAGAGWEAFLRCARETTGVASKSYSRGPAVDPSTMERQISDEKLAAAGAYLRMRFPRWLARRCWKAERVSMRTPHTTILSWIVSPKRKTFGALAVAPATDSSLPMQKK
jgi:hypothetical protein